MIELKRLELTNQQSLRIWLTEDIIFAFKDEFSALQNGNLSVVMKFGSTKISFRLDYKNSISFSAIDGKMSIVIVIDNNNREIILSFLDDYSSRGATKVNHIDMELLKPDGNVCDLALMFPKADSPQSGEILRKKLQGL